MLSRIVLSSGSVIESIFSRKPGRKSWLKKRNARTPRAHARSRQTASTAAHHVKELATQSSLIVIAVTKCVREISELVFCGRSGGTDLSLWHFLLLVFGDDGAEMLGHRRIQRA